MNIVQIVCWGIAIYAVIKVLDFIARCWASYSLEKRRQRMDEHWQKLWRDKWTGK